MRSLVLLFLFFVQNTALAFTFATTTKLAEPDFLPVDQAFQFYLSEPEDGKIVATWQIHDGYYLYQEQFGLSGQDSDKLHFSPFPAGKVKQDPYFGEVTVYRNQVILPIYYDINLPVGSQINAILSYQGCADRGLCYAPQKIPVDFTVPALSSALASTVQSSKQTTSTDFSHITPSESQSVSQLLQSSSPWTALAVLFGLGLLLSLTPCVLPMVPIVSAIVVGARESKLRAFYYSSVYVLAMALTYAAIGGLVGIFGTQLNLQAQLQSPVLLIISALIFVALALAMFGVYELKLPSSWQAKLQTTTNHSDSLWRSSGSIFLAGVFSTLIVSPCVSAPLAGTLLYISGQGNAWYGAMMLFVMALGMGVPLLLVGLFGPRILPKNGEWLDDIKNIMGFGLLAVSIWLVTRWLPLDSHLYLWSLLAISLSAYFIHRIYNLTSHPIRWFFALMFFLIGTVQFLGGALGNSDPLQPLSSSLSSSNNGALQENSTQSSHLDSIFDDSIGTLIELEAIVANQDPRPILLDLYADWCISCKVVEDMFLSPDIQTLLNNVQLIRVDVTENSSENQKLMQKFNLFGPPSLVFLDAQGEEIKPLTLMGEPTKASLSERLIAISNQ